MSLGTPILSLRYSRLCFTWREIGEMITHGDEKDLVFFRVVVMFIK
jgi:hypothetical protein